MRAPAIKHADKRPSFLRIYFFFVVAVALVSLQHVRRRMDAHSQHVVEIIIIFNWALLERERISAFVRRKQDFPRGALPKCKVALVTVDFYQILGGLNMFMVTVHNAYSF
jgi:hypothetical protein